MPVIPRLGTMCGDLLVSFADARAIRGLSNCELCPVTVVL